MYPAKISDYPVSIQGRARIERRIVNSLIREFLAGGFALRVFNGEEYSKRTTDAAKVREAILNTDEDVLMVYKLNATTVGGKPEHVGNVVLVYGNDGWDVMSDWHTSLDPFMPKTLALVESLS